MGRVRRRRHRQGLAITHPNRTAERQAIVRRWARLRSNGKPEWCRNEKVIFSTRWNALGCADELQAAGMVRVAAYPCQRPERAGDEHWHLTTADPAARAEKLARAGGAR